jgi:glycosyltransferase involved in cell wall biosynthesis
LAERELVIVDSSREPLDLPARDDVTVVRMAHGSPIGTKRNLALEAARSDWVAWFDDDDWSHPERLTRLLDAVGDAAWAASDRAWFLDLRARRALSHHRAGTAIFNSAVVRRRIAARFAFDERRSASDTRWLKKLTRSAGSPVIAPEVLSLWLVHGSNVSNPRLRAGPTVDETELTRSLGPEAWGDTTTQLQALRHRLLKDEIREKPPTQGVMGVGSRRAW